MAKTGGRKGQRSDEMKEAIRLLEEGEASSYAEAARITGVTPWAVSKCWKYDHGDEPIPRQGKHHAKTKKDNSVVARARAVDPDAVGEPEEPTPAERELAQKLLAVEARAATKATEARAAKARAKELETERDQAQSALDLTLSTRADAGEPDWLSLPEDDGVHHGTLVAAFSDYHIGEAIDPAEMAGYNAYNVEIAEQRVRRFFDKTIMISDQYLQGVEYDGIVVPSLGDTISGDIHDEYYETNELTNYQAVPLAFSWIRAGLRKFADRYGRVHYVGVPGNHPRDRKKTQYKRRSAHNADTLISNLLAKEFEDDERFTFDIPAGISADFQIYDTRFRIEHGDEARGGSGIQGAMLPIALRTHRLRKQAQAEGRPFDILMLGHWHQLMSMPAQGFMVNGAGKGYDEYARGKGFAPERPQQLLALVTPEHGIGATWPLFVDDREEEGW